VASLDANPARLEGQGFAQREKIGVRSWAEQIVFAPPDISARKSQPVNTWRDKNFEKLTSLYEGGEDGIICALVDQRQKVILTQRRLDL
jgi:hypothetical protein